MNLQQIKYILAVSEIKSFGKAAEKCYVSQSTLSTMIARFEKEIGIIIFDRKKKPIELTSEGEQILIQLKVVARELDMLDEVVSSLKGGLGSSLKIGVIPTVGPYLLPLFLHTFVKEYSNIHFEISEVTTDKIVQQIERRELDIGIVALPLQNPKLEELPLYLEPFLLYDAQEKQYNSEITIPELDFERFWLLEEGHCLRVQVKQICNLEEYAAQNKRNLEYKSGTVDTLIKLVDAHQGLTLLPLMSTLDLSVKQQQHLWHLQSPVPVRSIGLVTHQHFVKHKILKLLKNAILNKVNALYELPEQSVLVSPTI